LNRGAPGVRSPFDGLRMPVSGGKVGMAERALAGLGASLGV